MELTVVRFGPTTGTAPAVLPSPFLTTISLAGNTETELYPSELLVIMLVFGHQRNAVSVSTCIVQFISV